MYKIITSLCLLPEVQVSVHCRNIKYWQRNNHYAMRKQTLR